MGNVISNIVDKDTLRQKQLDTLECLSNALAKTFGPYGSNSIVYKKDGLPRYSKDGHTVLKSIMFNGEIEQSVLADLEEETRAQAKRVGDSTTSVTILSHLIFEGLCSIEKQVEIPPSELVEKFKAIIDLVIDEIKSNGRPTTLEDIYNISLICTNGNEELSKLISEIYNKFGLDVYIDVLAGTSEETMYKELDGMILECGFGDITLVNILEKNINSLRNPEIYFFRDPVDTVEMGAMFSAIVAKNILAPFKEQKFEGMIPTVILCPHFTRDYVPVLGLITSYCQQAAAKGLPSGIPLNIVTNITSADFEAYDDIREMCGGKWICKYIDPKQQEEDIAKGIAPTPETIPSWAGTAEVVESDISKTKFVNAKNVRDENGEFTSLFKSRIKFLDEHIADLTGKNNNTTELYKLKKRKNSLLGNMVEIYVGGITIADRDQARDLVEDAVLNCRSAVKNGVGYGANFEGFRAISTIQDRYVVGSETDAVSSLIIETIYSAYESITKLLYKYFDFNVNFDESVESYKGEKEDKLIMQSIINGCPFNIRTGEKGENVLSSIDTDICVLNIISKIITLMATANQFLLPTFNINKY